MTIASTTLKALTAIALLSTYAAGPAVAGNNTRNATAAHPKYSQALITQARKAHQSRSGDPEWDECMKKAGDDFIEALGACFCLTTPEAPCGEDHSEPAN